MHFRIHPAVILGAALIGSSLWLWARSANQLSHDFGVHMRAQVQNSRFRGTVLVAREGQVLFAHGYGLADAGQHVANRLNTRFPIASLSKQFTAVLVMKLQLQGKLRVSDSICLYLEPCPIAWSSVRIFELLSHTSGISNYTDDPSFMAVRDTARSRDQILATFRDKSLEFPPGEKYRYSNSNYFLLAIIVEKASGAAFEEVLRRHILTPLNMQETGLEGGKQPIAAQARGYRSDADGRPVDAAVMDPSWQFGAGDMYSTVGDLKKWDDALYGDALLPPGTLQSMWMAVKDDYGFGWEVPSISKATLNRRLVFHSGRTDGFVSCMSRFPDQKVLVIVLANYEMVKHACSIAGGLAAIAFGEQGTIRPDPVEVRLDPQLEAKYVGKYRVTSDIDVIVTLEDGHLFAAIGQIPKAEMYPASEREFFFKVFDTEIEFNMSSDGRASGFTAHIPLRADVVAQRVQ